MKRGRELLAGVVLAGMGIVFALAVLEVGIRWRHLVADRFWEPDPVLGVRLIPGHRGWWTKEDREFLVPVQINREGLRDVEHQYAKPAGVFRILVLGDSFVEAMHVPLESTFARLLEQRLNGDLGRGEIEVVSAGVSGYGTASEVLYFEREGKQYQPDLVLLAFYPGNDVKNNSPTLEDAFKPVYGPDGTLERVVEEGESVRPGGWRGLVARFDTYHYFRQILLTRHPELAQGLIREGLLRAEAVKTVPQQDGVPVDYGVYAPALDPDWEEAWSHTRSLLARLQGAVSAAGGHLAIAVVSTRDQIYPLWWQEVLASHPRMQQRTWDVDAPQRRVEAWCAEHDVPCKTLAPAFRAAAANSREPLHYHHDGHWTAAGHRLAASELAGFIEQYELASRVPTGQAGVSRNEGH